MSIVYNIAPKIGKRDRRIELMRATETRSDTGHTVDTWSTIATVWAHRKNQSQLTEGVDEMQIVAQATVNWVIRYRRDITLTEQDRVRYKSQIYDIVGIQEINRESLLEIKTVVNRDY